MIFKVKLTSSGDSQYKYITICDYKINREGNFRDNIYYTLCKQKIINVPSHAFSCFIYSDYPHLTIKCSYKINGTKWWVTYCMLEQLLSLNSSKLASTNRIRKVHPYISIKLPEVQLDLALYE